MTRGEILRGITEAAKTENSLLSETDFFLTELLRPLWVVIGLQTSEIRFAVPDF